MSEIYGAFFELLDRIGLRELKLLEVCLPFIILAGIIVFLARRSAQKKKLGAAFREERRRVLPNEIIFLVFFLWCGSVAVLTLIPDRLEAQILSFASTGKLLPGGGIGIRLIPYFRFSSDIFSGRFRFHELMNVLVFVPLGLLLPFLTKKPSLWKITLIGFCVTFGIEFKQMFIGRESDIDDVITNTLGTAAGYLIFMLIRRLFPRFTKKCSKKLIVKENENAETTAPHAPREQ